ncbi:MAG: glucose-1-phosphate thymidylyltransferase [Parcubacteria group bacterium Gr01-1014_70]|nr:MAG: glucose-1-phosphate thymidylyltransferase [Parcubacteria group bacterium Gr01-1014_70]
MNRLLKGVLLAGGTGSRLDPLTRVTNKHLLPVYNKPMIYYALETLHAVGLHDVLLVSGRGHAGHFLDLLGSGKDFGLDLSYEVQEEAGGIAEALGLAKDFAKGSGVVVILGDNIFTNSTDLKKGVEEFSQTPEGAHIFLKETNDANRFGVAEIQGNRIVGIEEKPKHPKTNLIVTGFYLYDESVFDVIKTLVPSGRGELEITDVNNYYIRAGVMKYSILTGEWTDAGTFDSLLRAGNLAKNPNDLFISIQ